VLSLACTALAFLLYFALIARAGAVRATVVNFVTPAVSVALAIGFLGESFTLGLAVGFPLVLLGSILGTRPVRASSSSEPGAVVVAPPP